MSLKSAATAHEGDRGILPGGGIILGLRLPFPGAGENEQGIGLMPGVDEQIAVVDDDGDSLVKVLSGYGVAGLREFCVGEGEGCEIGSWIPGISRDFCQPTGDIIDASRVFSRPIHLQKQSKQRGLLLRGNPGSV